MNVKYLTRTHTHTRTHTRTHALDKVNVITVLYKTMTLTPAAFEVLYNSINLLARKEAKLSAAKRQRRGGRERGKGEGAGECVLAVAKCMLAATSSLLVNGNRSTEEARQSTVPILNCIWNYLIYIYELWHHPYWL